MSMIALTKAHILAADYLHANTAAGQSGGTMLAIWQRLRFSGYRSNGFAKPIRRTFPLSCVREVQLAGIGV